MLAIKKSPGVAPEVNLKNLCAQPTKYVSEGSNLALKPKTGVPVSPQKEIMSFKNLKKRSYLSVE